MRVRDDPVGEMGEPLDIGQRLQRSLEAREEIPDRPRENKLTADIRIKVAKAIFHRQPEIYQDSHDGNDHPHTARDRNDFEPGWSRCLDEMMSSDVGVQKKNGPEADEGQRVAIQWSSANNGNDVVSGRLLPEG